MQRIAILALACWLPAAALDVQDVDMETINSFDELSILAPSTEVGVRLGPGEVRTNLAIGSSWVLDTHRVRVDEMGKALAEGDWYFDGALVDPQGNIVATFKANDYAPGLPGNTVVSDPHRWARNGEMAPGIYEVDMAGSGLADGGRYNGKLPAPTNVGKPGVVIFGTTYERTGVKFHKTYTTSEGCTTVPTYEILDLLAMAASSPAGLVQVMTDDNYIRRGDYIIPKHAGEPAVRFGRPTPSSSPRPAPRPGDDEDDQHDWEPAPRPTLTFNDDIPSVGGSSSGSAQDLSFGSDIPAYDPSNRDFSHPDTYSMGSYDDGPTTHDDVSGFEGYSMGESF